MRIKKRDGGAGNILRKYKMLFLVIAVVAVSGCIVPGGDVFQGMFEPQRPATSEGSADLIVTQNLNVIPNPPISAGNSFTVSFEAKNIDSKEEVKNVAIDHYDTGLCKPTTAGSGGGGGGSDSDIVQYTEGTNVTKFTVTCNKKSENLYVGENAATSETICEKKGEYKVTNLDAYSFYLYIDSHFEYFKYREVRTGEGEVYNCLTVIGSQNQCSKTYNGITYKITEIKNYDTAKCIGDSICAETTCSDYCNKQNEDVQKCKDRCSGETEETCISRCESYTKVVGTYQSAPCWPEFKPTGFFNGECCTCVYATTGFSDVSTSAPKAGAKTYYPLQTELKEWSFKAPSNSEIGNMPRACGIKYKITYDFTAKTQTDVSVISESKMNEMQRAGQTPFVSPMQTVGAGPIKVFFDFGASQPIKSENILPVFITIEDRGTGIYGNVLKGKLKIKMPPGFDLAASDSCSKFTKNGQEFTNSDEIPMIKKKSPQLRCSFKVPKVTDIKTFYITAELAYEYKLDDEVRVSINPTLVK